MVNCREQLYRDLNRLLDSEDLSKPVIGYTITVVTVDKPYIDGDTVTGDTTICAGGEPIACKKSIEQLLNVIEKEG